jgi:hypothetical protein
MPYADLEINFVQDDDAWRVELRLSSSDSHTDERLDLTLEPPARVKIDKSRLDAASLDADEYGRLLGEMLFHDPRVRNLYVRAHAKAQSLSVPLRLQLSGLNPYLHALRWELLQEPENGRRICVSEDVLLSRHVSGRQVERQPGDGQGLRSLVVVAGGKGTEPYIVDGHKLHPIDVAKERQRATRALQGTRMEILSGPCTIDAIGTRLRAGCDIFYLVCHGALFHERGVSKPVLFLEDDSGALTVVPAGELVERVAQLDAAMPLLAVVFSCQSAGDGLDERTSHSGGLAAVGPRLIKVGIPAVVAMNGDVTVDTVEAFMPAFFKKLRVAGSIDAAMADGRAAVQERPDNWMPVLFTRLRTGRFWPAEARLPDARWVDLMSHMAEGNIVPVLGAELLQPFIGSPRDIAREWAKTFDCALQVDEHEDLTRVAQYLAVNHGHGFPLSQLKQHVCRVTRDRFGQFAGFGNPTTPDAHLLAAAKTLWSRPEQYEPHAILASLPCRVYVTTNPDSLLAEALLGAGRSPQKLFFDRSKFPRKQPEEIDDPDDPSRPPVDKPIVYHLLGRFNAEESFVLTEDNYLDMLLGMRMQEAKMPSLVDRALATLGLLFLGFRLDDWSFRVLLRCIITHGGGAHRELFTNIAVQIDPNRPGVEEPEVARRYIESCFREAKVDIYWGTTESFLNELSARWKAHQGAVQ